MAKEDRLVEQHAHEYQARLNHIDELLQQADSGLRPEHTETKAELDQLRREREELAAKFQVGSGEAWETEAMKRFGPMAIWDTVAEKLEHLVERMGRH